MWHHFVTTCPTLLNPLYTPLYPALNPHEPSLQQVRKDILGLVFLPIEDKVATYGTLEQAQLVAELAVVPKPPSPSAGPVPGIAAEEVVAHVSAASRLVLAAMHQSVDRCIAFTGVTGVWGVCGDLSFIAEPARRRGSVWGQIACMHCT